MTHHHQQTSAMQPTNFDSSGLSNFKRAFTLPELLIATTIALLTSVGILFSYVQCLEINQINKTGVIVLQSATNLMEKIKATSFDDIHRTYNNQIFVIDSINGIRLVEVDDKNPELLGIRIRCFWKQAKGRLIGEDANLNGTMDPGEDLNQNSELDSPFTLFTLIYKREQPHVQE